MDQYWSIVDLPTNASCPVAKTDTRDDPHTTCRGIISHAKVNREIVGLILWKPSSRRDRDEIGTVSVEICEMDGGDALTSEPHCMGRRRCKRSIDTRDAIVIGEIHTHPAVHDSGAVSFSPHSNSDLFQLGLATVMGAHNCSVVVSHEGLYVASFRHESSELLKQDLDRFYGHHGYSKRQHRKAIRLCREPMEEHIPSDAVYLAQLMRTTENAFYVLMSDETIDDNRKRSVFSQTLADQLGIDIDFYRS
jgi:hypothetical protein